ncbi:MAG: DUF2442 domain-containing protein [Ruminococcus sp.]|uniref:DUF2442 domain-containing protein n=1 Tax=Ruminococcus sp. TaxID=41978 RepID=UPI00287314D4|nr:DUF2442 domain-containing protein [Ruminococcus sp.]MBQ3285443.1 DUF2442 domain-containing protein [Ruminococcus sp.]MBQ3286264.1 DUF2442 domain-containing protein [Ruminococcus sp.]
MEVRYGIFLRSAKPLPGHRIELIFKNGSTAVINMERRIGTLRFARIADEAVFASAKAEGDKVVWLDGNTPFAVYCSELLDAMMMD